MGKIKDGKILAKMNEALNYDNEKLGLKPNYTFGVNSYLKQIVDASTAKVTTTKIDQTGRVKPMGMLY